MRKVNYIMRTAFRATVSNVSRRGILNILRSAIFFIALVNKTPQDEEGGEKNTNCSDCNLQLLVVRFYFFFPLFFPRAHILPRSFGRAFSAKNILTVDDFTFVRNANCDMRFDIRYVTLIR